MIVLDAVSEWGAMNGMNKHREINEKKTEEKKRNYVQ